MSSSLFGGIPIPESVTRNNSNSLLSDFRGGRVSTDTRMVPVSVNLTALLIRLINTCLSRVGSAVIKSGISFCEKTSMESPLSFAARFISEWTSVRKPLRFTSLSESSSLLAIIRDISSKSFSKLRRCLPLVWIIDNSWFIGSLASSSSSSSV